LIDDACVFDLGPCDCVKVECVCGHVELLGAAMLRTAGLPDYEKITGHKRRLRCQECYEKDRVDVLSGGLAATQRLAEGQL
jgi:hypothetical protein